MNDQGHFSSGTLTTGPGLGKFIPPVLFQWPEFANQSQHEVACLFIDVAGFTTISEHLAQRGPEGAELLDLSIAHYFDGLLDIIEQYYGLPIKISGDALTVVFNKRHGDLTEAAWRALACAEALGRADSRPLPEIDITLPLAHKIGVGGGRLISGVVGDPRVRAEFVFAGEALDRAAAAEKHAQPGEVWAAPEIVAMIDRPDLWHELDPAGFRQLNSARSQILRDAVAEPRGSVCHPGPASLAQRASADRLPPAAGAPRGPADFCWGATALSHQVFTPAGAIGFVRDYATLIPSIVREHAAQGTLNYLCRHQSLTVLFAGAPTLTLDSPDALHQLDAHYRQMQQLIAQYGGFLSEFEAGDKGAKLIVLFGAPSALEDPCGQAARCARAMQQAAQELGVIHDQRIGLTTGRLYVGRIGCRSLVKYSALGDSMNLAARLMGAAGRWSILSDRHTAERSSPTVRWSPPQEVRIKGRDEPVEACSLLLSRVLRGQERRGRGLIGRMQERQEFARGLEKLLEGHGGLIHIQGTTGIGKTRLLECARRMALDRGIRRITTWSGTALLHPTPLCGWRALLLDLLGVPERVEPEELLDRFGQWHATLPDDLQPTAALLASILEIPWPVDAVLAQLPPERLLLLRQRGLVDCVLHCATDVPRTLLLDHAERLDDPSIQVLAELGPQLWSTALLVVIAHRTAPPDQKDPFEALYLLNDARQIHLKELTPREAARVATRRLKAQQLDGELDALLQARARGNPFLVEAWVDVLRDHGQIQVLENVAFLSGTKHMQVLPDRLEALILIQLEHLPPAAQLTVRVASVIGHSMTPAEVAALHPEGVSEAVVATHLRQAAQADLLWFDRANAPRMFFSRAEVREAIHDSLPFQLRRELHARRVQRLLRELNDEPGSDLVVLLAQHYEYIEEPAAQCRYFMAAMKVAQSRFDHRGTVRWARQFQAASERNDDPRGLLEAAPHLQQALMMLGENQERARVIDLWVNTAQALDDRESLVNALQARAHVRQWSGDSEGACLNVEQALTVVRSLDRQQLLINSLICACSVYGEAGKGQLALAAAEETLAYAAKDDTTRLIRIYHSRGFALGQLGRTAEAYQDCLNALKLCQATSDLWSQAVLLSNIGVTLWSLGYPEDGHSSLVRALELKRQVESRKQIGLGLLNVGYSHYRLGEFQKARGYTEDALKLFARVGYLRGELLALINLGEILWLSGCPREAEQLYARAASLLEKHPHEPIAIELGLRQGELALSQERFDAARSLFETTLERAATAGMIGFECNALEGLAEANRCLRELSTAHALITRALEKLRDAPSPVPLPQRIWSRAAQIASERGALEEATEFHLTARRLLDHERAQLSTPGSRSRLVKAFPWNRAIIHWRDVPEKLTLTGSRHIHDKQTDSV